MYYIFRNFISNLLLPPGFFLLLLVILAIIIYKRKEGYGYYNSKRNIYFIIMVLFISIYLCSSYLGEIIMVRPLEDNYSPVVINQLPNKEDIKTAIVILGGGINRGTPRNEEIAQKALSRLYEGFKIHQATGYDIVVTGGVPPTVEGSSEAKIMKEILIDWGVNRKDIIIEDKALTTWLNAINTTKILDEAGYKRILLVTNAIHMNRSIYSFKKNWDYKLIAAPATYLMESKVGFLRFLPNSHSLEKSLRAIHEWVGLLWYYISK
ncbi:YdcF family protein [Orenia marismortui]|uniref:Uncharacterized SAM-binding protein YcdF (DUF218 family) n=1 Tax=Orenia marismortui TaxID=46469 RepID=A0A4R8GP49_9FIRM|nr:YdcF family protein [Orenia marismortui]TDX46448.1 uncharacterized SAM-binding protein YcdF (DUF218 family) [Orenia marismortui]